MSDRNVWITDFRPAVGPGAEVIPYRRDDRPGHMLRFTSLDAPAVWVESPVTGWHEVYVGFWGASGVRIRMSGEPWYDWVESTVRWDRGPEDGEEAYWRLANLADDGFEILPLPFERPWSRRESQLAYLRLAPVGDAEAWRRQGGRRTRPTRTAGAVIDGHEDLGAWSPQTPDDVRGMITPYLDSDFLRLHWGCTVTTMRMAYVTHAGYYLGQGQPPDSLHTEINRRAARALAAAQRQGYDPLEVMIAFAEQNGLELWPSFRIQQDYPEDYSGGFGLDANSPLTAAHPEWRHVDRDGKVCSHLFSHFHEGWEQHKLDLLAEIARKGPAGIHLNLMCEAGAIWDFEPRAVARFRKEYGLDPLADPQPPIEWYRFRCDHLTAFMGRVREQTNRIGHELGRRIRIAVQVSADRHILHGQPFGARAESANFVHGFDIGRWAREGLVDVISPSFRRDYRPMFLDHVYDELGEYRDRIELVPSIGQHHADVFPRGYDWSVYFTDAGRDRRDLVPFGELDPWRILREANDLYHQGVDRVDVWEMGGVPSRLGRWNTMKHIGDREMLAREFGTRISGLAGRAEGTVRFEGGGGA